MLDRPNDGMDYARVAPGRIAGTISVHCSQAASSHETRVTVRYDVTSLGPEGIAFVEELQGEYAAFLDEWRREILCALAGEDDGEPRT